MKPFLLFVCTVLVSSTLLSQSSYTWAVGNGLWTVSTNWSPNRTTPSPNDTLQFISGGTKNIAGVPTETIKRLFISGNTIVNLSSNSPITLTIGNAGGDSLVVNTASRLSIGNNPSSSFTVGLADGAKANIKGYLIVGLAGVYNTDGLNVVTTVRTMLENFNNVICTDPARLVFNSGSFYQQTRAGGTVPPATWDINATVKIMGATTAIPTGLTQSFGNFEWDCGNQANELSLPAGIQIRGNFLVSRTGTGPKALMTDQTPLMIGGNFTVNNFNGKFKVADLAARTINVGGTLFVQGSRLDISTGSGTGTMNIAGSVSVTGGILDLSSGSGTGTINVAKNFTHTAGTITESGTGNGTIGFNGTITQNFTSGGTISNEVNFLVTANSVLQMAGPTTVIGGGGTFTLSPNAKLGIKSTAGISSSGATGHIQVTGVRTFDQDATYEYNGTAAQTTGNGLPSTVKWLIINNAAGVTLDAARSITARLTLTTGLLHTTSSNLLTFESASSVLPIPTNTAFVNGPVKKIGASAFVFPIGKNGVGYMPITISNPANITDAFQAEYIRASGSALGPVTDTLITHVSNCEYWHLDRTAGSSPVTIILYWNTNNPCGTPPYITDTASLRIAHFDTVSMSWNTSGKSFISGSATSGSISWVNVSTFSPFTFGSSTSLNPLPVTFTNVKAYEKDHGIRVEWSNLTETDIAYYTVERSADGRQFVPVGQITARENHGGREDYAWFDAIPLHGNNFYRIRATEYNNKGVLSKVIKMNFSAGNVSIILYPNPATGSQVTVEMNKMIAGEYSIRIISNDGKEVYQRSFLHPGGSYTENLELSPTLSPGIYKMVVSNGKIIETKTFLFH